MLDCGLDDWRSPSRSEPRCVLFQPPLPCRCCFAAMECRIDCRKHRMRTDCVTRWKVERKTRALTEYGPRMKPCRSQPRSCNSSVFRVRYHSVDLRMRRRRRTGIHEVYTTVRSRTARLLCCPMLHAAQRAARSVPKPATWQHLRHYMADEQPCTDEFRCDSQRTNWCSRACVRQTTTEAACQLPRQRAASPVHQSAATAPAETAHIIPHTHPKL